MIPFLGHLFFNVLVSGCQFDLVVCVQCGCIFHLIALTVVSVTHFFKNLTIHQCRVTLQYAFNISISSNVLFILQVYFNSTLSLIRPLSLLSRFKVQGSLLFVTYTIIQV